MRKQRPDGNTGVDELNLVLGNGENMVGQRHQSNVILHKKHVIVRVFIDGVSLIRIKRA